MASIKLGQLIRLRLVVSAMGEKFSPAWWASKATSVASLRVLSMVFPRNPRMAALADLGAGILDTIMVEPQHM